MTLDFAAAESAELVIPQASVDNSGSYAQGGVSEASTTLMCTSRVFLVLGKQEGGAARRLCRFNEHPGG